MILVSLNSICFRLMKPEANILDTNNESFTY